LWQRGSNSDIFLGKKQTINLLFVPLHLKKKNVELKITKIKSISVHQKRTKTHLQQYAASKNFFACGGLSSGCGHIDAIADPPAQNP